MPRRQLTRVALDLGTHKTTVLIAAMREDGPEVIGLGTVPSQGLRKGVVTSIDATVNAIQHALREAESMADCEIHSVVLSLSGNHVRGLNSHGMVPVRGGEVSPSDLELVLDAASAVALPAEREVLHVLPQEYVVDGQGGIREPLGMSGVRLEARVYVLTAASAAVQNAIKCCNRSGVTVSQVVLGPVASAQAVLTDEEREIGVALVDIGGGTTDLIVLHEGSVRHAAVLGLGGSQLTNDIATGLRTPPAEAERVKQRFGSALACDVGVEDRIEVPGVGERGPRVLARQILAEIIEPRVEEILTLVARELHRAGVEDLLNGGVVLTGGTASLSGIVKVADRVFQAPVRIGTPRQSGPLADIIAAPAYATGIGLLAMGGKEHVGRIPMMDSAAGVFAKVKDRMSDWLREFF